MQCNLNWTIRVHKLHQKEFFFLWAAPIRRSHASSGEALQMLIMGSMTGRQMWHLLWFLSARKLLSLISNVFPSPIFSFSPFQRFSDPRHSGIWRAAHEQMPLVCCVSPSLSYFPSSVSHTHIDASSHVILNHVWLSSLWADLLLGFVFIWDIVAGGRGRGGWGGRGCGASWVRAVWRRKGKKKVQACHLTPGAVVSQLAVPYTFIWPLSSAWEGRRPEERGKKEKAVSSLFLHCLCLEILVTRLWKMVRRGYVH